MFRMQMYLKMLIKWRRLYVFKMIYGLKSMSLTSISDDATDLYSLLLILFNWMRSNSNKCDKMISSLFYQSIQCILDILFPLRERYIYLIRIICLQYITFRTYLFRSVSCYFSIYD
jgi:hypothetical protein